MDKEGATKLPHTTASLSRVPEASLQSLKDVGWELRPAPCHTACFKSRRPSFLVSSPGCLHPLSLCTAGPSKAMGDGAPMEGVLMEGVKAPAAG